MAFAVLRWRIPAGSLTAGIYAVYRAILRPVTSHHTRPKSLHSQYYKKLSYRRETARQLPTWREGGVRHSSPLPLRPLWLYLCVWLNPKATT